MMKIAVYIVSILIFLPGLTFFLQGINILPGSYMTGDPKWAIIGAIAIAISVGLFIFGYRRK